jgi:23S rRNA (pseudouridine1915-N3)-methyltransferase
VFLFKNLKRNFEIIMQIDLITVGQKMPAWITTGFDEYAKRLPPTYRLNLITIPLRKRTKNADINRLQQQESEQILMTITEQTHVIALDERGEPWNTHQLANYLSQWQQRYSKIALLIGGPEGLTNQCRQRAQQQWSLSPLTLPHPLVRIIVAEQLYRAWSILNHHPYHRD